MRAEPPSSNRVIRGGSFRNDADTIIDNARCSNRNDNHPSKRNDNLGFRPAKASEGSIAPAARCARHAAEAQAALRACPRNCRGPKR